MLKKLFVLCGILLFAAALTVPQAVSDEWNKKTIMTVNDTLEIPGATLQPGKYVFKLADSLSNRHIVQVFNEDESQVLATILAIPNERLEPANGTVLELWETPKGAPHALRAWFYPGDTIGQEFRYPKEEAAKLTAEIHQEVPALTEEDQAVLEKHSADMTSKSNEPATVQQEPSAPSPVAENTPEQPRAESSETSPEQPSVANQQPQVQSPETQSAGTQAQSDVQEQQSGNSVTSGTSDVTKPAELPRTASYFPLLGLGGLVALGAALSIRISNIR